MPDELPYFRVALNLPHAGRVARRILHLMPESGARPVGGVDSHSDTVSRLEALLSPYLESDDNPPARIAGRVQTEAAILGRKLVDQIEREKAGHDRLGQCIRNLFECLELGQEGAAISLRAGEDPKSFHSPTRSRSRPRRQVPIREVNVLGSAGAVGFDRGRPQIAADATENHDQHCEGEYRGQNDDFQQTLHQRAGGAFRKTEWSATRLRRRPRIRMNQRDSNAGKNRWRVGPNGPGAQGAFNLSSRRVSSWTLAMIRSSSVGAQMFGCTAPR